MKKIYLLLACLFTLVGASFNYAVAQDDAVEIAINANSGDYTSWNNNASNPWAKGWKSASENPQVTISCGANNFAPWDKTNFQFFNCVGGSGTSYEYTFEASKGWQFQSISLDFVGSAADCEVTVSVEEVYSDANNSTEEFIHYDFEDFESGTRSFKFKVSANTSSKFAKTKDFVVTLVPMDPVDVALAELSDVYIKYEPYGFEGSTPFTAGTAPGDYAESAVDAFNEALTAALDLEGQSDITVEQVENAIKAIEDAYAAVLESKVPIVLQSGYYRFRTGLDYNDGLDKYMYVTVTSDAINGRWGTLEDLETNCTALWKVTNNGDDTYDIVSEATDARFNDNPATLSLESTHKMVLEAIGTVDDITYIGIRYASKEQGGNSYVHQANHGGGSGTGSNLTTWYPTESIAAINASSWVAEAVDDATAQAIIEAYAPIKNRAEMVDNYKKMVADAPGKLWIAKDSPVITVDEKNDLITEAEQLSSPWTESSEGSLDALLDDDKSTYWHSSWSGGSVDNHTHYLDVALPEAPEGLIAMTISRRAVANDHITLWSVYGASSADSENWVKLANLSTPFGNNTETIITEPFDPKGYQYLRFYIDGTTTGRGYGHISEFRLNPATMVIKQKAQYLVMGEVATNLENVLSAQLDVDPVNVTLEQYNALKAAYDAFIAKFVDPAPLREAIAAAEGASAGIVIGNNPGEWGAGTEVEQLSSELTNAKTYDENGAYSPSQSEAYIESLGNLSSNILSTANTIKTGKWYRIRFQTEEDNTKYGWDKGAGQATMSNNVEVDEALWGKYLTIADAETEKQAGENEEGEATEETVKMVVPVAADEITTGNFNLFFDADEDIEDKDLSLFRFVAVGDTAFVLQNKATGLFVKAAGASGAATASIQPSLVRVKAIGYGQNLISAQNLITDAAQNNLHGQKSYNVLVTWSASAAGSASGLYIEEAGDVDGSYDGSVFRFALKPGSVNSFCYPVGIEAGESDMEMYDVTSVADGKITLNVISKAIAGRPFIFIVDGDYNEEAEADPYVFKHDYNFVKEAGQGGLLKGTYVTVNELPKGSIVNKDDGFQVNKSAISALGGLYAPANTAYIQGEEEFELRDDYTYEITYGEDGIAATLQKVSGKSELYTIDGRLVSRKATLNDLKRYGKGVYILNGVKVAVK